MALSADKPRNYTVRGHENAMPAQVDVAYVGSALSKDSNGEVGPLAASEDFVGFCRKQADNSGGSAGDINVAVITEGEVELTITGLDDNDDLGDIVYASDDDTFTLTSSGNVAIGRVSQIVSTSDNKARVRFQGLTARDHT